MAASAKGAGATTGIVFGGFFCLGLILLAIAATVVLSLIGIYPSDNSAQGYGEEYRLNAILLKTIYTNSSYLRFRNGTVANSTDLSALCGTVYRTVGATNFAGCVAQNFQAFGPYNASNSTRRRRRAAVDTGIYMIGQTRIFHNTPCPKASDQGKYSTSGSLSACVSRRLALCNSIARGAAWTPLPTNFGLYIFESITQIFTRVPLTSVFSLPTAAVTALSGDTDLGLPTQTQQYLISGCQYIGQLPAASIAAILASQYTATTTVATSTNPGNG